MLRLVALKTLISIALFSAGYAVAQELPTPSFDPVLYERGTHSWRRPPEVRFVLLSGCGGGGGGGIAGNNRNTPALNGESSDVVTLVVPVTGDVYSVTVGEGGSFQSKATATTFSGDGSSITLQPGAQRPAIFAGSVWQGGEASPFGAGGEFVQSAAPNTVGKTNATARCAGGGGATVFFRVDNHGRGGAGFLRIVPLPDVDRFARVLGLLEELNTPSTPDDPQQPSSSETPVTEPEAPEETSP